MSKKPLPAETLDVILRRATRGFCSKAFPATLDRLPGLKQDHIMEDPGQKLRRIREKLNLTMRDVQEAAEVIAERRRSPEYKLFIGRLNDIETHSVVPSIYRLYSLCAIYRLDYREALKWYAVSLEDLIGDAVSLAHESTHLLDVTQIEGDLAAPLSLDPGIDLKKTVFLTRAIAKWGIVPLAILNTLDLKKLRYGLIGSDDWNMYPLIQPGALVTIDDSRKKIVNSGWTNEFERPIYFLEHRNGYACCWCTLNENTLVLQPHPASLCLPQVFRFPQDIDVIGQVSGVAMLLDPELRRNTRS